ncbi:MAG: hypothetical protein ACD_21C00039G0002 [uncultured bacterium]|nr:MAG: hypothetical protein ACD_21C00039G0002 [uncultured bacterium]
MGDNNDNRFRLVAKPQTTEPQGSNPYNRQPRALGLDNSPRLSIVRT